jgi:energy-converting hydrogenase Eha subunit B
MNGFYDLFLFLFCLGLVTGAINELGIFSVKVPTSGMNINSATVTDLQSGALSQAPNEFNAWQVIQSFMRVVGTGIAGVFLTGFLVWQFLIMCGADPGFASVIGALIQAMVTFVTLFGLYEWWTGRPVT